MSGALAFLAESSLRGQGLLPTGVEPIHEPFEQLFVLRAIGNVYVLGRIGGVIVKLVESRFTPVRGPFHQPITIRPLKVDNAIASFKAEGEPLNSKVRSKESKIEGLP